ncbi:ABC-three component system middle component 6 [Hathewaya massiliensis]|uniref:ABC-three component system middle component 6 n=1 Tax=Hathewaya massiliensis TaxID=1964382 RepID=UPI00115A8E16|nr:ABC-three component system middle component 6 [Hathewaya massiliensis]
MILPSKHIKISGSYLGLGALIISILKMPQTVDQCWQNYNSTYVYSKEIQKKHSFDNFILAIELLYILGVVDINNKGELYNVHY